MKSKFELQKLRFIYNLCNFSYKEVTILTQTKTDKPPQKIISRQCRIVREKEKTIVFL